MPPSLSWLRGGKWMDASRGCWMTVGRRVSAGGQGSGRSGRDGGANVALFPFKVISY